jgi:hypothetical protein
VIRLFKNSNPLSILLLVVIAAIPHLRFFSAENQPTTLVENGLLLHYFLQITEGFFEKATVLNMMVSTALVVIEALFFNKILVDQKIFERPGFLPALSYALMSSLVPHHYQSYMLIINGLLLISIRNILSVYKKNKVNNAIVVANFIIGLITCFSLSYLPLFFWIVISLLIMRPTSLREIMLAITGFFLPYYFLISGLFLTSNLIQTNLMQMPDFSIVVPNLDKLAWLKILFYTILPIMGLLGYNSTVGKMLIQGRKTYIVMLVLFLSTLLINAVSLVNFPFMLYILIVPGAFLITPLFISSKRTILPNILLLLIILLCFLG